MELKKYFLPAKIIFGEKTFEQLPAELKAAGVKKPLLICGKHFIPSLKFRVLQNALPFFRVFSGVEANPSTASVDEAAKMLNELKCDSVIGIGGGSVLDAAKVVACMKGFTKGSEAFYGKMKISRAQRVPFFALPTTSGSGSEATPYSVLTLPSGEKKGLKFREFFAAVAIVDPELTTSMPPELTASSGIDAFSQAVEAFWAKTSTPETDAFAKESIALSYQWLVKAVKVPDMQSRVMMAKASLTAARAFSNTGTTACHTVSYAFTKHYGLAHGFAVAISVPWFLGFYSESKSKQTRDKCKEICSILGANSVPEAQEKIRALLKSIGAPTRLSEIGCVREDFPKIIEMAAVNKPSNPRRHTTKDIERMLEELY